jgi:hypothetical protein
MDATYARERFRTSPLIRRLWPETMRRKTLDYFSIQAILNTAFTDPHRGTKGLNFQSLHTILTRTSLKFPVKWILLGDDMMYPHQIAEIRDNGDYNDDPEIRKHLAVHALSERDFKSAAERFAEENALKPSRQAVHLRLYSLCMAGNLKEARELIQENIKMYRNGAGSLYLDWLSATFGFSPGDKAENNAGAGSPDP